MSKLNIKIDLEKALVVYEKAFKSEAPVPSSLINGFCSFFGLLGFTEVYSDAILNELYKDSTDEAEERFLYWYPTYFITEKKENSFLPRIENLKKTIARLEKEISMEFVNSL